VGPGNASPSATTTPTKVKRKVKPKRRKTKHRKKRHRKVAKSGRSVPRAATHTMRGEG
jgi:hypothetical protein